jgi:hypothetical protein
MCKQKALYTYKCQQQWRTPLRYHNPTIIPTMLMPNNKMYMHGKITPKHKVVVPQSNTYFHPQAVNKWVQWCHRVSHSSKQFIILGRQLHQHSFIQIIDHFRATKLLKPQIDWYWNRQWFEKFGKLWQGLLSIHKFWLCIIGSTCTSN